MSKIKLNKVEVKVKKENQPTQLTFTTGVNIDKRKFNTGRPVNKKSNRQKRLAKQAFYSDVNKKFNNGNKFYVGIHEYRYTKGVNGLGSIFNVSVGSVYVADVSYIGRTKVKAHTLVLGKRVNVELNLKTLEFVS